MRTPTVNVLVFITVIPALPVFATWFLPWERWIPKWIPKNILGPYLLYCSFAAWYFRGPWWAILMVALLGIAVCVAAVSESAGSISTTPTELSNPSVASSSRVGLARSSGRLDAGTAESEPRLNTVIDAILSLAGLAAAALFPGG